MNATAILLLLTELAQMGIVFARLAERYRELVARAQAEGRDITAEELAQARAEREAAVARWLEGKPPAP